MPTKKWLHASCRTPLNQRGQSFVFNGMRVRMRAMCVRLHVKVLFALQFWSAATTHVSGQVAACVTTHTTAPVCSQFFPTLLNRETLGTHSQVATSRLVIFPFLRFTKKHRDRLQRLRASFVDSVLAAFNRKRSCRGPKLGFRTRACRTQAPRHEIKFTLHERTHRERCSANAAGVAKRLHV